MKVGDIQLLYDYNYWANGRIFDGTAQLSLDQFIAPRSYAHGSVRDTLVHILSAEWVWRIRCQDRISPPDLLQVADYPSLSVLQEKWGQEEVTMRHYLASLTDQKLENTISYQRTAGEPQENILWQLLVHVVNHGTEHRSTIAADLTEMGYSPGDLDFVHFLRQEII
jgi:uncharacterized damage-inducible protein DinB